MPHVYHAVDQLIDTPVVGSGTCVDLIKLYVPGLIGKPTTSWKEGIGVMEAQKSGKKLMRGTAIATFKNGRYPQSCAIGYHGSCHHAALLLSVQPGGIWILDQYAPSTRPTIKRRFISIPQASQSKLADGSHANAGNNAMAYSVIE